MSSGRLKFKKNSNNNSEISISINNSFYEEQDDDIKRDINFLIESGFDKEKVIKIYLILKPSNVNEANHFLTKENGLYQHIFYPSSKNSERCEICREGINNHIKSNNDSIKSKNDESTISNQNQFNDVIRYTNKKDNIKCRICEDCFNNENNIYECEKCHNYFCYECLYLYIKESIRNGKCDFLCPDCKLIIKENKIQKIFSINNIKYKNEIKELKKLYQKNKTKKIVLSNKNLMFCPIKDCEGYAEKKSKQKYNKCNLGHKFCSQCGDIWHKNGKCPKEDNIDELFQQFYKKLKLKKCPNCHIATLKRGGCNHINCTYCNKNWCWLCEEIFDSIDDHYGNPDTKCYNKMMGDLIDQDLCNKCQNPKDSFQTFVKCGHTICDDCFENYLLENNAFKLSNITEIKCPYENCNQNSQFNTEIFIKFILENDNANITRKYRKQILFYKYNLINIIMIFSFNQYWKIYISEILLKLYDLISDPFYYSCRNSDGYIILEIIGIIFGLIFLLVYTIIFPLFFHITIQRFYYKFLKETIFDFNKKLKVPIIIGIELISIIFLFPLIAFHYIYSVFALIYKLIITIKKMIKPF